MLVKLVNDANGEHLVVFYTVYNVIHKYVYKKTVDDKLQLKI